MTCLTTWRCGAATSLRYSARWLLLCLCCGVAQGAPGELILQNDSIAPPGAGTPLPNFLPGEQAASWLTASNTGSIVGVQLVWDSQFGANFPSTEMAITVYAGGVFPTPGPPLAVVTAPVLHDAMINEFRFLDPPTNNSPLNVPVSAGQKVVVALEFFNQSSGNATASSIAYDTDGCQSNTNSIFTFPAAAWSDACAAGVQGDFGIRAILQPVPEPPTAGLVAAALAVAVLASRRIR